MRRRLLGAACASLLAVSSVGTAAAGTPARDRTSLDVDELGASVVVIARPGSSVSIQATPPVSGRPGTLLLSMRTKRDKSLRDAGAYASSGRSVVGDLVALGMPREQAVREFGDLATLAGGTGTVTRQRVTMAGGATAGASGSVTPYDTQCASINIAGGKITGYGCATFFLVRQRGSDWWLMTKMKVSAHSTDESWFSPKRLTQLGWRVTWGAGNLLHDWDPYTTQPVGSCATVTVRSNSPWAEVSVQGNICPESLGPWAVTTARSGGIWNGWEHGTDYEGALATQAVHSPTGVAVAYQSAWTLSYCDLWCI